MFYYFKWNVNWFSYWLFSSLIFFQRNMPICIVWNNGICLTISLTFNISDHCCVLLDLSFSLLWSSTRRSLTTPADESFIRFLTARIWFIDKTYKYELYHLNEKLRVKSSMHKLYYIMISLSLFITLILHVTFYWKSLTKDFNWEHNFKILIVSVLDNFKQWAYAKKKTKQLLKPRKAELICILERPDWFCLLGFTCIADKYRWSTKQHRLCV